MTAATGGTTTWKNEGDGRHDDAARGEGRHDDGDRRHGDSNRQQGNMRHNDGDGRHDNCKTYCSCTPGSASIAMGDMLQQS